MSNTRSEISIDPADDLAIREVLREAGLNGFRPTAMAYRLGPNEKQDLPAPVLIDLASIRPPVRSDGAPQLVHHRTLRVLQGFAADAPLPGIVVYSSPTEQYAYRLGDGFHRFHLSRLVGFTEIPAVVLGYWEPWMTGDPMP